MSDVFKAVLFKLGKYLPIRGVASAAAGNKSIIIFLGSNQQQLFIKNLLLAKRHQLFIMQHFQELLFVCRSWDSGRRLCDGSSHPEFDSCRCPSSVRLQVNRLQRSGASATQLGRHQPAVRGLGSIGHRAGSRFPSDATQLSRGGLLPHGLHVRREAMPDEVGLPFRQATVGCQGRLCSDHGSVNCRGRHARGPARSLLGLEKLDHVH